MRGGPVRLEVQVKLCTCCPEEVRGAGSVTPPHGRARGGVWRGVKYVLAVLAHRGQRW